MSVDYWKLKSATVEFEKYWNEKNKAELEKHWSLVERLARESGCRPNCSLLDVGCGIGNLVLFTSLASKDNYLGIDISLSMIERARALYPGYSFEVSELKPELRESDLVVANGFLSHQHDFFLKLDRLAGLTRICLIFDLMVAREGDSVRSATGYWARTLGRDEYQFMKKDLENEFSLEEVKYGEWSGHREYYLRCDKKRT